MNKALAKEIIEMIHTFIQSDLYWRNPSSNVQSKLVHGISELATFLGFKIGMYSFKYKYKSQHLTRFYKLKADLQRKRILESEKYFKMVECIFSKLHREVAHLVTTTGQILLKKSCFKAIYDYRAQIKVMQSLKYSLANIEAKLLSIPLT
jgi:hypothetical protein